MPFEVFRLWSSAGMAKLQKSVNNECHSRKLTDKYIIDNNIVTNGKLALLPSDVTPLSITNINEKQAPTFLLSDLADCPPQAFPASAIRYITTYVSYGLYKIFTDKYTPFFALHRLCLFLKYLCFTRKRVQQYSITSWDWFYDSVLLVPASNAQTSKETEKSKIFFSVNLRILCTMFHRRLENEIDFSEKIDTHWNPKKTRSGSNQSRKRCISRQIFYWRILYLNVLLEKFLPQISFNVCKCWKFFWNFDFFRIQNFIDQMLEF